MVRITWIQEIKLRIAQFILTNSRLKFRPIPGDEASGFINDIFFKRLRKIFVKVVNLYD